MPSLDYEVEKTEFRDFYESSRDRMEGTKSALLTLVRSLLATDAAIANAKVEGRIKDRDECLSKFRRKYQTTLESAKEPYSIGNHISDLIGLRVVCFYEDEVERIQELVAAEFEVLEITDKSAQMEESDNAFGYKGVHMDLKFTKKRRAMKEYASYADFPFELQIRTVVQDSWSVLDHKIKYKKSIPNDLKRRINTLAALFELADREFKAIRDGTDEAIERTEAYAAIEAETVSAAPEPLQTVVDARSRRFTPLDAFNLLRISKHFFNNDDFEPHKIDGFAQEIVRFEPNISRGKFNFYLREAIGEVRRYKAEFEVEPDAGTMNAFTVMRHCLYAGNPDHFAPMLTDRARTAFDDWRASNKVD
jgi:putative GTP pyrophosphokinase